MPKISRSFLELLKKKLSFGSTKSILLNCLPGRLSSRLSLNDFNITKIDFSKEFIAYLTSKQDFEIKFSIKYNSPKNGEQLELLQEKEQENGKKQKFERRLTNIKYDHDDIKKEQGVETFGFGFPILVRRNPNDITKLISAPLFIWHLDIKQTFDQSKGWVITRKPDTAIMVNEALRAYLKSEQQVDLPKLPDSMLEDGILEKQEIETFISELQQKLNITNPKIADWNLIDQVPDKIVVEEEIIGESRIIFSGVFGIYKNQKQSLINDLDHLLKESKNDIENKDIQLKWENTTTPIEVDPSQHLVLRSLTSRNKVVIQGPPGTGKSQTLTAIIASALSDNKKVLVVCEKRTALEVLFQNIVKKYSYLEKAIALLEDVSSDRNVIVKNARERELAPDKFIIENSSTSALKVSTKHYEKIINEADLKYSNLRVLIKDNKRWIECVADWIKYDIKNDEIAEIAWLSTKLDFINDLILPETVGYEIQNSQLQYQKIEPYLNEYDKTFAPINSSSVSNILSIEIRNLCYEITNILAEINEFDQLLSKNIEKITEIQISEIHLKHERYSKIILELKSHISDPTRISLVDKLLLLFKTNRKYILELYQEANKIDAELRENIFNLLNIKEISPNQFKEILSSNKVKISEQIKNKLYNLSYARNSQLENKLIEKWTRYNNLFDELHKKISIIVEIKSFSKPSDDLRNTINQWIEIKDFLERLNSKSIEVDNYFKWKKSFSELSMQVAGLVKIMIDKNYQNWIESFNRAYLYKILTDTVQSKEMLQDENHLTNIQHVQDSITPIQESVLRSNLNLWFNRGLAQLEGSKISFKKLYNLRGSAGESRNSLLKIINYNLSAFTDIYPLVLANPTTVSTLFPMQNNIFDLVIFDEASQLRIEDTFSSLYRGKSAIISGDSQQMPPSSYFESTKTTIDTIDDSELDTDLEERMLEESEIEMASKESLLEWAIQEGYTETYLDMHYRSKHPDLIEFSNVCFYNSRLIPMPGSISEAPITYVAVNGLYENRTNNDEATKVVQILKNDIPNNKSVGVATFNLTQRNLILDLIAKERFADRSFNDKMTLLDQNGFFVKNLENVQGDERDIIIISTTFGVKSNGAFTMMFGPIGQKNGYRLLNVIITRAKEKLFVLTSIPEVKQHEYRNFILNEAKVSGKSGLLAYLLYCKHVSEGNNKAKEELLSDIQMLIKSGLTRRAKDIGLTESPFEEEVYQMLITEFDPVNIIPQYKCGGFRIDLVVISPTSQKKIAIECDGAAYHSSELNWHHDIYRQRQLEKEGFLFHRIWSTNWWKNQNTEFRKLVDFVNQN